jgi:hypothetical protein
MTMRRLAPFVLVLVVVAMTGCAWFGSSSSNANSPNQNTNSASRTNTTSATTTQHSEAPSNWRSAGDKVQSALEKASSNKQPAYTVTQVNNEVKQALTELGNDEVEVRDKCKKCKEDAIVIALDARKDLADVVAFLQPLPNNPLSADAKSEVTPLLRDADRKLRTAISTTTAPEVTELITTTSPSPSSQPTKETVDPRENYGTWDYVILGLAILGGLLVLALIGMGILHFRNESRQHLEARLGKVAAAQATVTREAQKEILDKLSSLSSAQTDTNTRLHEVHTEIRTLARLVRETSPSRGDGRSYASIAASYSYNEPSLPKDEPEFPVSAVDYLDKMTRFANVVRPDFQNGILVNDPDGTGELVVIRDSRQDDGRLLFLVPRHAQFQTKQDFYTYYEKYYDCARPAGGDVWIIGPAMVEKVTGGWQLREKGLLEIRS